MPFRATLPDATCSLQKLEVLKLKECRKLRCLPEHLTSLQNLRHLVVEDCDSLSRMFPYIGKLTCLRTLSVYTVSLEKGYSLAELQHLNLGGKLQIKGLENVGNLQEAREANLINKKDLQEISFVWTYVIQIKTAPTNGEQVLEVLQPHSNLKRLLIYGYDGSCFPSWIGILSSLTSLSLQFCNNCVRLSQLGKLPSLKILRLMQMDTIQYLDDDECHSGVEVRHFPSLEELELIRLGNIERLLKVERGEMFPCLSNLTISSCPKLIRLPCLPYVKDLGVYGSCNNELLRSISSYSGLTTLIIQRNDEMERSMTSFPDGMFRNLTCLQSLTISNMPELKELPNELFELEKLKRLGFSRCEALKSLPDGIRHLTSLEVLEIYSCPILEDKYKEGTGEEWDMIAHIPKVNIIPERETEED